jgi:hypothetical protein
VDNEIDSITAPVAGSCGAPAWTARVPKLWTGDGGRGGVATGSELRGAEDMFSARVRSLLERGDEGIERDEKRRRRKEGRKEGRKKM